MKDIARFLHIGITMAMTIGFFAIVGYLVDAWLGSLPLVLIISVLLGTFMMLWYVYKNS